MWHGGRMCQFDATWKELVRRLKGVCENQQDSGNEWE